MKIIKLPDGTEIEDRRKKPRWIPSYFGKRMYKKHTEMIDRYKAKMISLFKEIEENDLFGETEEGDV